MKPFSAIFSKLSDRQLDGVILALQATITIAPKRFYIARTVALHACIEEKRRREQARVQSVGGTPSEELPL